ncbi:MAG: radical SAM protein [Planctomycetes bacterium]|nr:radical SAM protein [Planctomycetota bacterium]
MLQPSPAAFELLRGFEHAELTELLADRLTRDFGGVTLESVLAEVTMLADLGLFVLERLETPEERDDSIRRHIELPTRSGQVLVQTSCNLKCTYCYEVAAKFHDTGKSMSLDAGLQSLELLFQRLGKRKHLDITFFGGEPLLNFALVRQLVARAYVRAEELGKTVGFRMTTNGTLLDDEKIAFLVEHRFAVMVSIDGPPEFADRQRIDHAGRGTTAKAVANARRLIAAQRAAGMREAMIRATLTQQNPSREAVAGYFAENDFQRTMIGSSDGRAHEKRWTDFGGSETASANADVERALDQYLESRRDDTVRPPLGFDFSAGLKRVRDGLASGLQVRRTPMCGTGRNTTAVTEHGDLYPCHRYAGEESYRIGTLSTGIDRERLGRYFAEIFDGYDRHCSACWARAICGGQCPWYLSRPDGHVGTPDDASCDEIRRGTERLLWLAAIEAESTSTPAGERSAPPAHGDSKP